MSLTTDNNAKIAIDNVNLGDRAVKSGRVEKLVAIVTQSEIVAELRCARLQFASKRSQLMSGSVRVNPLDRNDDDDIAITTKN
jgi:hypothetical protein